MKEKLNTIGLLAPLACIFAAHDLLGCSSVKRQ